MTPVISKETMAALLGRSLSTLEDTNYSLYLNLAILRLDDLLCQKVEEMTTIPEDLQLLLARMFGCTVKEQSASSDSGVASKKVEDFSITYKDESESPMDSLLKLNVNLIAKYSACQAEIRSGEVAHDCIRCI